MTVDDDLKDALQKEAARARFRQQTFRMGNPSRSDLDKALQLAALLEDAGRARARTMNPSDTSE